MHRLLQRQLKKCFGRAADFPPEWQPFLQMVEEAYAQEDSDRELLEHSMELSSCELLERNRQLSQAEIKYRSIFEHATEGIFQVAPDGRVISANPALACILGYESPAELETAVQDFGRQIYVNPARWDELVAGMARQGTISQLESQARRKDGSVIWISETSRMVVTGDGAAAKLSHYEGTVRDVTLRRHAEDERKELQDRLFSLSRQAGMAEVASSVLHNVGNVLNSVNVAVTIATKRLQKSPVEHLINIVSLLKAHEGDLGPFLTADAKGRLVPAFLASVVEMLSGEQQFLLKEMGQLARNLEHIKQVVNLQQSYARRPEMKEDVNLHALIDEALELAAAGGERSPIAVERQFGDLPEIMTDKHQVLQILLNLLTNARHSVAASEQSRKHILVRSRLDQAEAAGFAVVEVKDNGLGMDPAVLAQLFTHGFTTKIDGHGFGLHASANAAKHLGGFLTAHSDGPGKGAAFCLKLPLQREVTHK
jgi:PAS domain S-box-containing protein